MTEGSSRVLLIHHDPVARRQLQANLESDGYRVGVLEDPNLVVDSLLHEHCDAILVDLQLPDEEAFHVLEQIHGQSAFAHLPVVVLGLPDRGDDLLKALGLGAVDYLTYLHHPQARVFLKARLENALSGRRLKQFQLDQLRAVHQIMKAAGSLKNDTFNPATLDELSQRGDSLGQLAKVFQGFGQEVLARGKSPARVLEELRGELLKSIQVQGARSDTTGRVLVVDDDSASRKLVAIYLRQLLYTVEEADRGAEGLEILESRPIDVVISDLAMPDMDGFELLQRIKAHPRLHDLPVILISSEDNPSILAQSIEAGATDHFYKPFDQRLLAARLRACLVSKRLRDQELSYLNGVTTLTQAAAAMEEEDFQPEMLAAVARHDDALGRLARVFQDMARQVATRQQTLKHQVSELKAELEEARERSKLGASTQSDYFHNVQEGSLTLGRTQVVAFVSFRGGTGKSSVVANLGLLLASGGCKVGLVDAALESPGLHSLFGLTPQDWSHSLQDVLFERSEISKAALDLTTRCGASGRLVLVPASSKLGTMARLLRQGYQSQRFTSALQSLAQQFELDVVLIDTHSGLNEEVLLSMLLAQKTLVMLRPDQQDYEGTGVLLQVAEKLKASQVELFLNEAPAHQLHQLEKETTDTFACPLVCALPFSEEMVTMPAAGGGLFAANYPEHPITLALRKLARHLVQS